MAGVHHIIRMPKCMLDLRVVTKFAGMHFVGFQRKHSIASRRPGIHLFNLQLILDASLIWQGKEGRYRKLRAIGEEDQSKVQDLRWSVM